MYQKHRKQKKMSVLGGMPSLVEELSVEEGDLSGRSVANYELCSRDIIKK